eukprot:TRINITY_DN10603_c0_g3_i1.p1 TRINITY_DN10603_c0_g3~~TRINITY_DN10603_c0_g3_i1.p1  ORF type:complete len:306 (+),score=76.39 TRINITY_DN10603_c0_g3_i1:232-1149(+)
MANLEEADKALKKADKYTKVTLTRWGPDFEKATPLYEKAASLYKLAKNLEKAKHCYERASTGQCRTDNKWLGAKHLESAASLAKELKQWDEVLDTYKRAAELYNEVGRPQVAAEAYGKAAKAIEAEKPEEAIKLYIEAISVFEEEQKEGLASDLYRAAGAAMIKSKKYEDAANLFIRWGQACDATKAVASQCKHYLSAIIILLYAEDLAKAELCYNDLSGVDAFSNSEQGRCASQLLDAYHDKNVDDIKYIVKDSNVIPHLDHLVVRLAKGLPTGNVIEMKKSANKTLNMKDEDEELGIDEDDMT